jgi:hypothetical protein
VFVALGFQTAMCIAILSPLASPAVQYFLALFHKFTIFEKYSIIKFHDNPSSGCRVFYTDSRADMTYLMFTLRNFVDAKKGLIQKEVTQY